MYMYVCVSACVCVCVSVMCLLVLQSQLAAQFTMQNDCSADFEDFSASNWT